MKYLITEQQLKGLLENQNLLNALLDKIRNGGIESLSVDEKEYLDRLSKGEEFDSEDDDLDNDEFDEESYYDFQSPVVSFFNMIPTFKEIEVNDENYGVSVNDDEFGDSIVVSGPNIEIYIVPFWENTGDIKIDTVSGRSLKLKSNKIPEDTKSMREYIDNFYSEIIPKIITKLS